MEVKQKAKILNDVFGELIGSYTPEDEEPQLFNEDLSNFVEVGRKIEATSEWGKNFDNYWGSIIDRIGRTMVVNKDYKSQAPNLDVDGSEYGSILQKIRVGVPDFKENPAWTLTQNKGQEFNYTTYDPVELRATYWNSKTSRMMNWSWAIKQLKEAVTNRSVIDQIFAAIENKIRVKMTIENDGLKMRLVNNINAVNISYGRQVNVLYNFLQECDLTNIAANNSNICSRNALQSHEFLRYLQMTLKKHRKYIGQASVLCNTEEEFNWTQGDRLRMVAIEDVDSALQSYLASDTYHNEFVNFDGYTSIAAWQGLMPGFKFEDRSRIECQAVIGPYNPDDEKTADNLLDPISFSGIIFTMFDRDGAVIWNEEPETDVAPYNPVGKFYNYYFTYDCSYLVDLAENSFTFVISDYQVLDSQPVDWATKYGDYYELDETGFVAAKPAPATKNKRTGDDPEPTAPTFVKGKYYFKFADLD